MEKVSKILDLIRDDRCAVVGVGVSNLPLIDFLLSKGASVTAYDEKDALKMADTAEILSGKGVSLVLGAGAFDKISERVIFRSPGVRPDKGALSQSKTNRAVVTSEMELFFELCPAKKYAITGSDGKTTTTTLTHLFLSTQKEREGARAFVGGNIGAPLLPHVYEMSENDAAVLELSSFQLMGEWCEADAVAITNITPNHLNWHTDMREYIDAKCGIVGKGTKRVVLNADNDVCASLDFSEREYIYFSSTKNDYGEIVSHRGGSALFLRDGKIVFSDGKSETEILSTSDIKLPGKHNIENYMTAIALTYGEVEFDIYREVAKTFGGVAHRLELVATVDGVRYYNSSIDSSPTRTAAALSALDVKPIVICGGSEKGVAFDTLATSLAKRAAAVVLNGASRESMLKAIEACRECDALPRYVFETLGEAIDCARKIAKANDVVLLSPAAASFDQFENFSKRGEFFKSTVLSWSNEEN